MKFYLDLLNVKEVDVSPMDLCELIWPIAVVEGRVWPLDFLRKEAINKENINEVIIMVIKVLIPPLPHFSTHELKPCQWTKVP